MKPYIPHVLCVATLLLEAGCVSRESNVVRDSERAKVQFETETAARNFFAAMEKGGFAPTQAHSTTKLELPIIFEYRKNVTTGPNASFNRAVEICDTNRDGKITELESKIFLDHPRP